MRTTNPTPTQTPTGRLARGDLRARFPRPGSAQALPSGERVVRPAAVLLAGGGAVLPVAPHVLSTVTTA